MELLDYEAALRIGKGAETTLKYIYKKLHHSCYMLRVKGVPTMYKLESSGTAPTFVRAIARQLLRLKGNRKVSASQKEVIVRRMKDPVRVMQCIVKEFGGLKSPDNEYMAILRKCRLPEGVCIMNLTDAVILRNDNREPFVMVTGDVSMEEEFQVDHVPIFSMSGAKGYRDIPIPTYDDLGYVTGNALPSYVAWADKVYSQAVFRGGPTGCGYTAETNMRIKIAQMKSPLLNAKLRVHKAHEKARLADSRSIRFDPKYGIGMMNTGLMEGDYLSMSEQAKYKYIVHIDGNVLAYRLLGTFCTGSLMLRVESPYVSWADEWLRPNVHYVSIKGDLSDLEDKIVLMNKFPLIAQSIATAGREFALKALTQEFVIRRVEELMWAAHPKGLKDTETEETGLRDTVDAEEPTEDTEEPTEEPTEVEDKKELKEDKKVEDKKELKEDKKVEDKKELKEDKKVEDKEALKEDKKEDKEALKEDKKVDKKVEDKKALKVEDKEVEDKEALKEEVKADSDDVKGGALLFKKTTSLTEDRAPNESKNNPYNKDSPEQEDSKKNPKNTNIVSVHKKTRPFKAIKNKTIKNI